MITVTIVFILLNIERQKFEMQNHIIYNILYE